MHEMRVRVMTAPAFTGDKVIGAILFERTMDGEVQGKPVPPSCGKTAASCRSSRSTRGWRPKATASA